MSNFNISDSEIEAQFLDFMRANNCEPEGNFRLMLDGQIHRFRVQNDKHGEKSGAYCVFYDGWPAGWCQNWHGGGQAISWSFNRYDLNDSQQKSLSDAEYEKLLEVSRRHQEQLKKQLEQDTIIASEKARILFESLPFALNENQPPYAIKKQIYLYGDLKVSQDNKSIAVPLYNIKGHIVNIQWISEDGEKRFFPKAPVSGNFFPMFLEEADNDDKKVILIGEGMATMSIVRKLTQLPCVAAMNCGNLKKVAQAIRQKYPNNPIVFMADNDRKNPNNPGLVHAEDANKTLNLDGVVYPDFAENEEGSDWNDFYILHDCDNNFCERAITKKFKQLPVFNPCLKYQAQAEQLGLLKAESFTSFIQPLPGENFLIDGWIPTESMMMMFAPSGSGKGFVAVDLAYAIANPEVPDWHGKKINKHGPVIYMAGEGQKGLRKRFAGIAEYWRTNANVPINKTRLGVIQEALPINDDNPDLGINRAIANIGRMTTEPALVIIDTTNRYMSGDENKTPDATSFIQAATKIINEFHCSVLIIHHTGLSQETQGRARGSSVFKAAMDMEFRISKNNKFITLEMTKSKDSEIQKPLVFEMKQVAAPGFFTDNGYQDTTCILEHNEQMSETVSEKKQKTEKMNKIEKFARDTYRQAAIEFGIFIQDPNSARSVVAVDVEKWREVAYRQSAADKEGTRRMQFRRARESLLEAKKILFKYSIEDKEYYWLMPLDTEYDIGITQEVTNRNSKAKE